MDQSQSDQLHHVLFEEGPPAQVSPHFHQLQVGPHAGSFIRELCADLKLEVGLSCDHDSDGEPIDGSELFEVVNLPLEGVTVVDIDLKHTPLKKLFPEWASMKPAELKAALRTQIPPSLITVNHKTAEGVEKDESWSEFKRLDADAVVVTAQGWHLVFLEGNVEHPLADKSYQEISTKERGYWSMRTHNKPAQDLPDYCKDLAGKIRTMRGLSPRGTRLAEGWNRLALAADEHRLYRAAQNLNNWGPNNSAG